MVARVKRTQERPMSTTAHYHPQVEWIKGVIERIIIPPVAEPTPIELPFRVEWGEFMTPEARPYRITFSAPFKAPPTVQCAGSARVGEVVPPKFEPYEFKPLKVSPPVLEVPSVPLITIKIPVLEAPVIPTPPTVRMPLFEKPTIDVPTVSIPAVPSVETAVPTIPPPKLTVPTFAPIAIPDIIKLFSDIRAKSRELLIAMWPHGWMCARVGLAEALRVIDCAFHEEIAKLYKGFMDSIKASIDRSIKTFLDTMSANVTELTRWGRDEIKARVEAAFTDVRTRVAGGFSTLKSEVDGKLGATKASIEGAITRAKAEIEGKIGRTFDSIHAAWHDVIAAMRTLEAIKPEVEGKIGRSFKSIHEADTANKAALESAFMKLKSEVDAKLSKWISETVRITDGFNYTFEEMTKRALEGLAHTTKQAQTAVKSAIEGLYSMLGVRKGIFVSPVAIKTVTKEHFEIEGVPEARYFWFAIGER